MSARDRAASAGLALFVVALAGALMARGVRLAEEDGFYYFKIAQNAAAGLGPTFDGLHPTNGFHPLWLLVLIPVFRLAASPEQALAAATLLQACLAAGATALVYRLARASAGTAAAAAAAFVWLALTLPVALSGVEFALHAAIVAGAAAWYRFRLAEPRTASPGAAIVMGAILALAVLARLDNVLLAALTAMALARRGPSGRPATLRLLAVTTPPLLALAATLAANAALAGAPLPISGLAKRAWSGRLLAQDPVYQSYGWAAAKAANILRPALRLPSPAALAIVVGGWGAGAACLAGLAASSGHAARSRPEPPGAVLLPLSPFAVFGLVQLLAYGVVYHGHYSYAPWYWVVQPLLAALLAAAATERLRERTSRAVAILACAAAAGAAVGVALSHAARQVSLDGPLYVAARWARENLPPGARVGSWNAGAIGFLSGRQVVNLDGVVNTPRFFAVEQYDLCSYWDRTGVTHLVDVFEAREGSAAMMGGTLPVWRHYERCLSRLQQVWSQPLAGNPGWPKAFLIRRAPDAAP